MTQLPIFGRTFDRAADPTLPAPPPDRSASSSLLAGLATRLTTWRRRTKQARDFRGLGQRQLRDLGLNHFDQW